ncbi:type II toxin-antitoxin system RelE/ParE family toxin [uncultured Hoeflea sp.]|uniref:type II toxin-antitoxin system RelE/ParE family toxin n=1 Tax=uncultured Hoeflea sp. TaxID=538666 RepID=UPI0030DC2831|tara:strand:- start:1182 stop:1487 length:306 start_codon:yes stop_codon:yes gene_type:complete
MERYRLSKAADRDFERIFEFGIDQFGLVQALDYQNGMKRRFEQLATQPKLYQSVDHIRQGYRRSVYRAHSIYYRIDRDFVLIVRILGRENPDTSLPDHDGG